MGARGDPKLLSRDVASCTYYSCADYLDEPPYLTKSVRNRFSEMEGPTGHQSEDSALRTDFFFSIQLSMFEDGDLNLQLLSCQNSAPRPEVCFLGAIVWRLSKRPGVGKVKLLSPRAENSPYLPPNSSYGFPGLYLVPDCRCWTARVKPSMRPADLVDLVARSGAKGRAGGSAPDPGRKAFSGYLFRG